MLCPRWGSTSFTEHTTSFLQVFQVGMALQEMDLHLHYRPGKTYQNADTLSCTPLTCHSELPEGSEEKVVATLTTSAKDWKMIGLAERQNNGNELRPIMEY